MHHDPSPGKELQSPKRQAEFIPRVCTPTELRYAPAMPFATSPSSFSSLRPPLLRLARLGTTFPIEVIVTVFCAVTLVYFQLLKVSICFTGLWDMLEREEEAEKECRKVPRPISGDRGRSQGGRRVALHPRVLLQVYPRAAYPKGAPKEQWSLPSSSEDMIYSSDLNHPQRKLTPPSPSLVDS